MSFKQGCHGHETSDTDWIRIKEWLSYRIGYEIIWDYIMLVSDNFGHGY